MSVPAVDRHAARTKPQRRPSGRHRREQHANRLLRKKSSGWNLFKRGKAAPRKKKPGKLPPGPDAQSKDSREAAADILREMTRRR